MEAPGGDERVPGPVRHQAHPYEPRNPHCGQRWWRGGAAVWPVAEDRVGLPGSAIHETLSAVAGSRASGAGAGGGVGREVRALQRGRWRGYCSRRALGAAPAPPQPRGPSCLLRPDARVGLGHGRGLDFMGGTQGARLQASCSRLSLFKSGPGMLEELATAPMTFGGGGHLLQKPSLLAAHPSGPSRGLGALGAGTGTAWGSPDTPSWAPSSVRHQCRPWLLPPRYALSLCPFPSHSHQHPTPNSCRAGRLLYQWQLPWSRRLAPGHVQGTFTPQTGALPIPGRVLGLLGHPTPLSSQGTHTFGRESLLVS